MTTTDYRYNRADFRPLRVTLEHLDIHLSFEGGEVHGTNTLRMIAREQTSRVRLDARDIEIHEVTWIGDEERPLEYEYRASENALVMTLPRTVQADTVFTIRTRSTCIPSDNILEGIYLDTTPEGCPQQYMSQCQQWGFQRILPVIDDCRAKCTMITTIEGDARYTHMISNGNICRATNPDGKPVPCPDKPGRQVITFENEFPMAPYLFLVCLGTWDVLEDEVIYPSGRHVALEYLVPPGRKAGAVIPMEILKRSVLWQAETQEYEYQRDAYRTICMEKSNFGGMENVGNTTIITSAALVDEYIGDRRLEYAHGIIVHEFEHNQCGSDVTMETPFDMWLNEAFTVDVERQFMMSEFDPDGMRLGDVDAMRSPIHGPLTIEDGGHMGNIVREGFNDPDELVDGVTYVKAAEVIRMLKLILGAEPFRKAKNVYFETYTGSTANTDQFFECFERVGGRDLAQFRREWLHTIGYPQLKASHSYDAAGRRLVVTFEQTRTGTGGDFHVPIEFAAVAADGRDIDGTAGVVEMTGPSLECVFEGVDEPAFMSYNRDCSFYGTFVDLCATPESMAQQILLDGNAFNRVEAMRHLTDLERTRLIEDRGTTVSDAWLDTYGMLLRDDSVSPGLKAYLLRIDEQSMNRQFLPRFPERYEARIRLLESVAARHMDLLVEVFDNVDTYAPASAPKDGVEARRLKAILLRAIVAADTTAAHELAEAHFRRAWHISDRQAALACINLSSHPAREALMREARTLWQPHLAAFMGYLSIVGSSPHDDVFACLAAEEAQPEFLLEHPSHNRALFMPMASNNKMLWTSRGIDWLRDTVIRLGPVNENSALHVLASCRLVDGMSEELRTPVLEAMRAMQNAVDAEAAPSLRGRIDAYLKGADAT